MEKLKFSIDNIELIDERNDSQFALVSIDVFASGDNRHHKPVSEETLRKFATSIYWKPLTWSYSRYFDDADTHDDENVPCGFVHENIQNFRTLEDGRVMMSVKALIWKYYSGRLMDIFSRDDGKKSVSVEMDVFQENSVSHEIIDFRFCAITILGDHVRPAVPGAKSEITKFAEEYKQAFLQEFASKYEDVDFSIPEKIKANVQKGLDLHKKFGKGNSVSLAMARFIAKNKDISPDRIKSINKYFASHKPASYKKDEEPSLEVISWYLWGGKEAIVWSSEIVKTMKSMDEEKLTYYSDDSTEKKGSYITEEMLNSPDKKEDESSPVYLGETQKTSEGSKNSDMKKTKDEMASEEEVSEKDEMAVENTEKTENEEMASEVKTKDEEEKPAETQMAESTDEEKTEGQDEKDKEKKDGEEMSAKDAEDENNEDNREEVIEGEITEEAMSSNEYADVAAMLANLKSETESQEDVATAYRSTDGKFDFEKMSKSLFAKMQTIQSENETLKQFKAGVEKKEFDFAVNSTLKEVENSLPKEELEKAKEDSVNFSIETVGVWVNAVQAKAYTFSKGKNTQSEFDGIVVSAFPFNGRAEVNDSPWGN